jgi:hypothetical protein
MGFTAYWHGLMVGDREWLVERDQWPEVEIPYGVDEATHFHLLFAAMREWVEAANAPSFATNSFDDDFAYLCVGAGGQVRGQILFDWTRAADSYGIELPADDREAGPEGVAAWAKAYAPSWTCANVVEALALCGGAADGVTQLMRILSIDLPGE